MREASVTGLRAMISRRTAKAMIMPRIVRERFAWVYDFSRCCLR